MPQRHLGRRDQRRDRRCACSRGIGHARPRGGARIERRRARHRCGCGRARRAARPCCEGGARGGGSAHANTLRARSRTDRRSLRRRSGGACSRRTRGSADPAADHGGGRHLRPGRWRGASMSVHFIGAGPGAADLITVRGRDLLGRCPVCLYAGSIVPAELLAYCPAGARLVDTAPMTLDEIEAEYVTAHAAGADVARLHSGDLSVFSADAEQIRRLERRGIPYTLTPGVPAFAAAAALLGRELTVPEVAQSVILTRLPGRASQMPAAERLQAFAATGATLVLHLAIQSLDRIVCVLIPVCGEDCPIAVVARATWADELIVRGTLATIKAQLATERIELTVAIENGDLERDVGALEHARRRSPACSRDEISEGKIFLRRMLEGFRRRIRREDALAQCRRRLLRERGERVQVHAATLRMQIEKPLGELRHLRDTAGDGESRQRMLA